MFRCVLGLLLPLTMFGCGSTSHPTVPESVPLSSEATRLFDIASGKHPPYGDRQKAVADLKEMGSDGVPALIQLLPGGGDVITRDVIYALGEIGDPRALPKLYEMQNAKVDRSGKINYAMRCAIDSIESKQAGKR